eukprot:3052503-Rhodomonas_salina.1
MSGTDIAYGAPVLTYYMVKTSTYAATRCPLLTLRMALPDCCYAIPGTDTATGTTRALLVLAPVRDRPLSRRVLRPPYAMSGTDLAYAATSSYISSTASAGPSSRYGAVMSAYGLAMRCPVLAKHGAQLAA